MTAKDKALVLA